MTQWQHRSHDRGGGKKDFILILCPSQLQREDHICCRDRAGHHRHIPSPSSLLNNNEPWIPLLHLSQSRFIPPQHWSFQYDTGRHSVKCNFSTCLARRLYQNSSLESDMFQRSCLAKMQGRKRRLKEELQAEEQQVELMMERLKETNRVRDITHNMTGKIKLGEMRFQASVQWRRVMKLFRAMQHKSCARKAIALFFQHCYLGWWGWAHAESRREFLRQTRRDESASTIQANVQRVIQRWRYLDLLLEKEQLSNQSATAFQAMTRVRITRQMYQAEMKRQCNAIIFVIGIGQDIMGCILQEWENETQGRGGRMQNQESGGIAMGNLMLSIPGSGGGEGDMFVASFHGKKMEEWKR